MATKGRVADMRNKFLARIAATSSSGGSTSVAKTPSTTDNGVFDEKQSSVRRPQPPHRHAPNPTQANRRGAPTADSRGGMPAVVERNSTSVVGVAVAPRDNSQRGKPSYSHSKVAELRQVVDLRSAPPLRSSPRMDSRTGSGTAASVRPVCNGRPTEVIDSNGWHHNGNTWKAEDYNPVTPPSPTWIANLNGSYSESTRCRSSSIDRSFAPPTSHHRSSSPLSTPNHQHRSGHQIYTNIDQYATLRRSQRSFAIQHSQQREKHHQQNQLETAGNVARDRRDHVMQRRHEGQRSSKFADTDEERLSPFSTSATVAVSQVQIDEKTSQRYADNHVVNGASLPDDVIITSPYATLRRRPAGSSAANRKPVSHSRHSIADDSYSVSSSTSMSSNAAVQEAQLAEIQQLRNDLEWAKQQIAFLTSNLSTNVNAVHVFDKTLSSLADRVQALNVDQSTDQPRAHSSDLSDLLGVIQRLRNKKPPAMASSPVDDDLDDSAVWYRQLGTVPSGKQRSERLSTQPALQPANGRPCSGGVNLSRHPSLLRGGKAFNYPDSAARGSTLSLQYSSTSMNSVGDSSTDESTRSHGSLKKWLKSSIGKAFSRKKTPSCVTLTDETLSTADESLLCSTPSQLSMTDLRVTQELPPSVLPAEYCATVGRHRKWPSTKSPHVTNGNGINGCGSSSAYPKHTTAFVDDFNEEDLNGGSPAVLRRSIQPSMMSQSMIAATVPFNDPQRHGNTRRTSLHEQQASASLIDLLLKANDRRQTTAASRKLAVTVSITEDILPADHQSHRIAPRDVIGTCRVQTSTDWLALDSTVQRVFKSYLQRIDPSTNLGLSADSVLSYCIGEHTRHIGMSPPELLPIGYIVGDVGSVCINLKGDNEFCLDQLAFETLVSKSTLHRYVSLLYDHRKLVLHGSSGTGKSFMAMKLAQCIVRRSKVPLTTDSIAILHSEGSSHAHSAFDHVTHRRVLPSVVILDDVTPASLNDGTVFAGITCLESSFVVATMNQAPIEQQHQQPQRQQHENNGITSSTAGSCFHPIHYANQLEPVHGFLGRYMRRRVAETEADVGGSSPSDLIRVIEWLPKVWHKVNKYLDVLSPTTDITIGPKLFLACPMEVNKSLVWFTDLWNYFIVPYLSEAVRQSIQLQLIKSTDSCRVRWMDLVDWMTDSWPWPPTIIGMTTTRPESNGGFSGTSSSSAGLRGPVTALRMRCADVGFDELVPSDLDQSDTTPHTNSTSTAIVNGDPLMKMLAKLQDTAENASDSDSTVDFVGSYC